MWSDARTGRCTRHLHRDSATIHVQGSGVFVDEEPRVKCRCGLRRRRRDRCQRGEVGVFASKGRPDERLERARGGKMVQRHRLDREHLFCRHLGKGNRAEVPGVVRATGDGVLIRRAGGRLRALGGGGCSQRGGKENRERTHEASRCERTRRQYSPRRIPITRQLEPVAGFRNAFGIPIIGG